MKKMIIYKNTFILNLLLNIVTAKSGTQMVPRQTKALELGCTVMEQGGNSVSALVSTPQYSRQRYMPLRHVQLRI
jgi:hypothetical protein